MWSAGRGTIQTSRCGVMVMAPRNAALVEKAGPVLLQVSHPPLRIVIVACVDGTVAPLCCPSLVLPYWTAAGRPPHHHGSLSPVFSAEHSREEPSRQGERQSTLFLSVARGFGLLTSSRRTSSSLYLKRRQPNEMPKDTFKSIILLSKSRRNRPQPPIPSSQRPSVVVMVSCKAQSRK